jgi:hypothetical protein
MAESRALLIDCQVPAQFPAIQQSSLRRQSGIKEARIATRCCRIVTDAADASRQPHEIVRI